MADKRAALLQEFNTVIAPQKAGLSQRLPQLFTQYYAPPSELPNQASQQQAYGNGGAAGVTAGAGGGAITGRTSQPANKRPSELQMQDSSKRLKAAPSMQDDLDRKMEALLKEVGNLIVKRLWNKKECLYFKEPVDPIKLRIPDYFNYVKTPMDLGTVRNKLNRREYKSPADACEDIRLVWRNCASYNQPGTLVRKAGDMLADVWEKAWAESRIDERWHDLQAMKDPAGAVPLKATQLSRQVKSMVNQLPAGNSNQSTDTTVMSELDKRRLSIHVSELQGEQLAHLLTLIQAELPPAGPDGEVELDMDALPVSTLYKMQDYVLSLTGAPRPHIPPRKPGLAETGGAATHHHQQQQQLQQQHDAGGMQPAAGPGGNDNDSMMPGSSAPSSPGVSGESQDEVKGSTADEPHQKGAFVYPHNSHRNAGVDESATAPGLQSSILRDKAAGRKTDVHVNTAAWDASALQTGAAEENGDADGAEDEVWINFKAREEQKRQQAEEQRKLKEQQEEELRKKRDAAEEEARRAANEAAERERALAEEEARMQQEAQRARMEQCDKEVDEIKARQGTANLVQRDDLPGLIVQAQPSEGDLAAVGLTYKNDDDDVNFDDE